MMQSIIATLVTSLTLTTPIQAKPPDITLPVKPIPIVRQISHVEAPKTFEKLELLPFPVAPVGTYQNDYEAENCTFYVASRKQIPNSMGDANKWADVLGNMGYIVNHTPAKGAIAQSTAGFYGHVTLIEEVYPDGSFRISEMNYVGLGIISERTIYDAWNWNIIHI